MHYSSTLTGILSVLANIAIMLFILNPVKCQDIKMDTGRVLENKGTYEDSVVPRLHPGVVKDSLIRYRDSLTGIMRDVLGDGASAIDKDSLAQFISGFPSTDSLKRFLASALGFDKQRLNRDSAWIKLRSQASGRFKKNVDVLKAYLHSPSDSTLRAKWKSLLANTPKAPSSVITVGGGFINYNYMFRSALDTPYMEQNMGQHLVMAGFDATVADIPVKITYYGRRSNSIYLRDYNDVRSRSPG